MEGKKIDIYWTRHAESCSNFDQGHVDDVPVSDYNSLNNVGYSWKKSTTTNTSTIEKSIPSQLKATSMYHPNLSFVGMQHAILLGTDFYHNTTTPRMDVVFTSATVRTIMTALLARRSFPDKKIYVVPFISERINPLGYSEYISSFINDTFKSNLEFGDFQNTPLKSSRLKRIIAFIKDWLSENWIKYFDDIEVITNLIDLRSILNHNHNKKNGPDDVYEKYTTIIDTILSCKPQIIRKNDGKRMSDTIYNESYGSCVDNIIPLLKDLAKSFHENPSIYGDIEYYPSKNYGENLKRLETFFTMLEDDDKTKKYFRGPPVDFSILEYYEKINNDNPNFKLFAGLNDKVEDYFNKFYTDVLKYAIDQGILPKDKEHLYISCISHGNNMRNYFSKKYPTMFDNKYLKHMYNSQTFLETIENLDFYNYNGKNNFKTDAYIPKLIRSKYENFEILNMDICRTESVKGVINYPLWDIDKERNMIPSTEFGSMSHYPRHYATSDVKFALPEKYTGKSTLGFDVATEKDIKYYNDEYKSTVLHGGSFQPRDDASGTSDIYMRKYMKYKNKYIKEKMKM